MFQLIHFHTKTEFLLTANFGLLTDISYGCLTIFERNTCAAPLPGLQQAANPLCIPVFYQLYRAKTRPFYILNEVCFFQISGSFFFRTGGVNFFWERVPNFCKLGIGTGSMWITHQTLWVGQ
jgi:hypothetical protein